MKLSKFVTVLTVGLLLTLVAAGCKRNPKNVTVLPANSGVAGSGVPDTGMSGTLPANPGTEGSGVTGIPANDPGSHLNWPRNESFFEANTVHFAYDSSVVRSEDKSKIAAVADHLKANPGTAVEVEGHCDERGTDEYNRALGERRALAVREELVALGVEAKRVDTISYGRQRPIDNSGTEEGRSRNRRGVFILLTPP
jgi:peptidoglycan-associated lipoprotein